jgi:hypothetical protein
MDYLVTYHVIGTDKPYAPSQNRVALREGYSTFSDIPKIVSIRRGLKPENIVVDFAMRLEEGE